MPIYTNDPYDDGLFPVDPSLRSSIGIGPKVTKAIDAATKDWLDDHPEATTTVKDNSLTNAKFMDGSVNSRVIEDESITTDDIADLAITTPKIADDAVTAAKIASAAVDGLRTMSTIQPGVAKVGAGLAMNNGALELDGSGDIATAVTSWLNAHPEATTTVQDGAVTTPKLANGAVTDAKLTQTGGVLEHVDAIDSYIFDMVDIGTDITQIDGITSMQEHNAAPMSSQSFTGILTSTLSSYDTYWFVTDNDIDIYVDSVEVGYFAISYGSDFTQAVPQSDDNVALMCTNPTRVRKSDDNLPTSENKLSISAGSAVVFTITAGATQIVYGLGTSRVVKESFKEEVNKPKKTCTLRYLTQSGDNPEVVQVFVPTNVGYVRYDFAHTVIPGNNCNVWRVDRAYAVTDTFAERFTLTTAGEWECALHLRDAPDFSGGRAHGDEVMSSVVFLVDGELVDITELTDMTVFDSLVIAQVSTLYDPNDNVTEIAQHGSEHVFSIDGLTINQTVTWSVAEELGPCYMAMLPAAKAVINRVFTDKDYATTVADGTRQGKSGAKKATLYSTASGVMMRFAIDQYPEVSGGSNSAKKYFLLTDNTADQSGPYNKCYYVITTDVTGAVTSSVGEEWKETTLYEIRVGK